MCECVCVIAGEGNKVLARTRSRRALVISDPLQSFFDGCP